MKAQAGVLLGLASALTLWGCACSSGNCPSDPVYSPSTSTSTSSTSSGAFTSFAAIAKPGTANLPGITTEGSYTANTTSFDVTGHTTPSQGTGTVTLTVDANGNPTALTLSGAQSSANFSIANGSTSGGLPAGYIYALSANGQQLAIGADYTAQGFNYQSYGIWATGLGTGSGFTGAISAGAVTPNGSVPTTGSATYNGTAGGVYVDSTGAQWLATSSATLNANFANHSVAYSTSGTAGVSTQSASVALPNAQALNMTGTLSYSTGTNGFSGTVTATGGLTGPAQGRFYGPAANEAGGTFALTGSGVQGYLGAFGAVAATTP